MFLDHMSHTPIENRPIHMRIPRLRGTPREYLEFVTGVYRNGRYFDDDGNYLFGYITWQYANNDKDDDGN